MSDLKAKMHLNRFRLGLGPKPCFHITCMLNSNRTNKATKRAPWDLDTVSCVFGRAAARTPVGEFLALP